MLSFEDCVVDVGVRPSCTQTFGFGASAQDALFDVLLHWASAESEQGHRFWHVQRSLVDFEHLNAQLTRDRHTSCQQAGFPVHEVRQFKHEQDQFTRRVTIQQEQHRELRLAWALESYMRQTLGDAALSSSMALKKFIYTDIVSLNESSGTVYQQQITAQCNSRRPTTQGDERVAAGCSFDHTVLISSPEKEGKTIVFWKFRSNPNDRLVFSASFSPQQQSGSQMNSLDPYSAADGFAETFTTDTATQEVVHYRTPYEFAGDNSFASGHVVLDRPGELTFCWENVDTSSIVSKDLCFEVHEVPVEPAAELEIFLAVLDGIHNEEDPMWLATVLKQSPLQSLEDVTGSLAQTEENEPEQEDGWSVVDSPAMTMGPQNGQYQQRMKELEDKVQLYEDQLAELKQELKRAQDHAYTTDAIYKASLETITQLEHELFQLRRQQQSTGVLSNGYDSSPSPAVDENEKYSDEEDEEERAEEEAAEITRLRNLCATFQEQCLWRSIETAESEKQRLALEALLAQSKEQHDQLNERLQAHEEALVQLKMQNRTLRAHKTLLVQEVKKLQPFSQVNVATLMMDAQEARMMQRSLQARLDAVQLSDQSQQQ